MHTPYHLRHHRTLLAPLVAALILASCGERITQEDVDQIGTTLADVMVEVQRGGDSTRRAQIADSVSREHGFDSWDDLRAEVDVIATEPDRLRAMLDSTQRRIEARTR